MFYTNFHYKDVFQDILMDISRRPRYLNSISGSKYLRNRFVTGIDEFLNVGSTNEFDVDLKINVASIMKENAYGLMVNRIRQDIGSFPHQNEIRMQFNDTEANFTVLSSILYSILSVIEAELSYQEVGKVIPHWMTGRKTMFEGIGTLQNIVEYNKRIYRKNGYFKNVAVELVADSIVRATNIAISRLTVDTSGRGYSSRVDSNHLLIRYLGGPVAIRQHAERYSSMYKEFLKNSKKVPSTDEINELVNSYNNDFIVDFSLLDDKTHSSEQKVEG